MYRSALMYWHAVWKWLPSVAVPYGLAKSRLAKTQANTILWDAFKINLDYELDEMALKKVLDLGQGFSQQRQSAPPKELPIWHRTRTQHDPTKYAFWNQL